MAERTEIIVTHDGHTPCVPGTATIVRVIVDGRCCWVEHRAAARTFLAVLHRRRLDPWLWTVIDSFRQTPVRGFLPAAERSGGHWIVATDQPRCGWCFSFPNCLPTPVPAVRVTHVVPLGSAWESGVVPLPVPPGQTARHYAAGRPDDPILASLASVGVKRWACSADCRALDQDGAALRVTSTVRHDARCPPTQTQAVLGGYAVVYTGGSLVSLTSAWRRSVRTAVCG